MELLYTGYCKYTGENEIQKSCYVICRGAIGYGKTTALEYVTKKYREDGWTVEWMEDSFDEPCIERIQKTRYRKNSYLC